jgi:hypothetical protein
VLEEVLAELRRPAHLGGCGDSGRLDKAGQLASKTYQLRLTLFSDEQQVARTLAEVQQLIAEL